MAYCRSSGAPMNSLRSSLILSSSSARSLASRAFIKGKHSQRWRFPTTISALAQTMKNRERVKRLPIRRAIRYLVKNFPRRSRTISSRPISGLLGRGRIGKLDAVAFGNVVVVGASRPVVDMRPHVAPHSANVLFATRDSMVLFIEAERALGSVSEILRLNRVWIGPKAEVAFSRGILGCGVSGSIGGSLLALKLLVMPRQSGLNLIEINIFAVRQEHLA